jgi:anti-sigma-K factor RskA
VSTRSHDEYQDNIGAYVLGALPELEHEVLERHIETCDSCRAEVARLMPVTDVLARSVPQVMPPASLKAGLMETVKAEAKARTADERARKPSRSWWPQALQPRVAAAAALAVLAIGVVIGVAADQSADRSERVIAAKIDRTLMPSGGATLEVSGDRRDVTLKLTDAPDPGKGRLYELWVRRNGKVIPGPVVRQGGNGEITIPGGVTDADAVMVTVEEKRVTKPTGPVVMTFDV